MVRIVTLAAALTIATSSVAFAKNSLGGDPQKGAVVFQRCQLCHTAMKDGGNGLGPNLYGVVGRKAASLPNFGYSDALKKSNIVWTDAMLRKWVAGPQKVVPGTRMAFAGLSNNRDIENVIAYLRSKK